MQERFVPTPPDDSDLSTPQDGYSEAAFLEKQPDIPEVNNHEVAAEPLTLELRLAQAATLGAIKSELERWSTADPESELGQLVRNTWPAEKSVAEVLKNLKKAEQSLPASFDDAHPNLLKALGAVSRVFKLRDQVRIHFLEISYALALLDQTTPTLDQIFTGLNILEGQGYVFWVKRGLELESRTPATILTAISGAYEGSLTTELLTTRLRKIRFWVDHITSKYDLDLKVYYLLTKNWPIAREKYRLPRRLVLENRYQNYLRAVGAD